MDIYQASSSNFDALNQYISDAVIWLTTNLSISHLNHKACELYQWDLSVVGENYISLCQKEEKDALIKVEWLEGLNKTNDIHDIITIKLAPNNTEKLTFTVHLTHLRDTNDGSIGYMLIAKDISLEIRLKNIVNIDEAYLEDIIENMPGLVYWKDKNYQYMGCNKNVATFSGLKSRADVVGKRDEDFSWGQGMAESFRADDKEVMRTGKLKITVHKLPIMNEFGQQIYVRTEKRPLVDKHGQVVGVLGVALDVTNELEVEKLNKEKKIAEKTIDRLKAIAGSIVHQIGDPLGTVKIASEFNYKILQKLIENYQKSIQKKGIKPNISDQDVHLSKMYADQIQLMIEQTGFIINNHLINIKHNSWHTETDWIILKPESISKIVEKALAEHPFTPEQKLLVHWQKGEDFNILGIDNLISNVISNLLNNALKSIERAKKGEITIWLTQDKQFNYLHIKDTGDGLPHAGRQEIFKPFHSNHEGTGLGLYFCKSVMQGYNGDITCRGQKKHPAYAQFTLKFLKCATAKKIYRKKIKTV